MTKKCTTTDRTVNMASNSKVEADSMDFRSGFETCLSSTALAISSVNSSSILDIW